MEVWVADLGCEGKGTLEQSIMGHRGRYEETARASLREWNK